MIQFKTITIRNFLSFGNNKTVIDLDSNKVTLIMGKNYDVGVSGSSKNGVGKSTIFQAISWVLFGEGINHIKQDNFINLKNKNKMEVTLQLIVDGKEFTVTRGRKPNKFEILVDGNPYTRHNVDSNEELIKELLGMDIDLFFNTSLLSSNIEPFMNKKPTAQKQFMENLLSLNILAKYVEKMKENKKEVETEILLEEVSKNNFIKNKEEQKEHLQYLIDKKEVWDKEKSSKILELEEDLQKLKSIDLEEIRDILARNAEVKIKINTLQSDIKDLRVEKELELNKVNLKEKDLNLELLEEKNSVKDALSEEKMKEIESLEIGFSDEEDNICNIKDKLSSSLSSFKELKNDCKEIEKLLKEKESIYKSLKKGKCHFCDQDYSSPDMISEYEDEIKNLKEVLSNIETKKGETEREVEDYQETISKLERDLNSRKRSKRDEVEKKFKSQLDSITQNIEDSFKDKNQEFKNIKNTIEEKFRKKISDIEGVMSFLENGITPIEFTESDIEVIINNIYNVSKNIKDCQESVNPFLDQIGDLKIKLKETFDEDKMKELDNEKYHYEMLIKLLSDNKSFIRKKLVNDSVTIINRIVNEFLLELDSPHAIQINSDLSVDIDYMNKSVSYGNLSNGERLRLNIAISLAFRKLIESTGKNINFLAIDELLDNGLDSAGFHKVFKLLKKFENKSIFIISHREELITEVDNVITVSKKNGFSSINY